MVTEAYYTKEDMKPVVDFLAKGAERIGEESYRESVDKIVNNFDIALEAAGEEAEKRAYLFALYVNNAAAMASYLFLNDNLPEEMVKEFRTLPTGKDSDAAILPYKQASEAKRDEISQMQRDFMEHNKGLEVFKGIALGDSPEQAKQSVDAYEQKIAQELAQSR